MNTGKIDALILKYKDEMIADLQRWISVPTVQAPAAGPDAPFGAELRRMLDMALEDGRRYGFEVSDCDGYAGDISFGSGEQTLGMLCHLDVVPVGDGWKHDPWGGEVENGRLYGRGSIDDKGPAICALYAMRAVKDAGVPLKDGVRLILGCDEETGMTDMRHYASKKKMPDYGFSPDATFPVINIEKGRLEMVLTAETDGVGSTIDVLNVTSGERVNVVPGTACALVKPKNGLDPAASIAARADHARYSVKDNGDGTYLLTATGESAHASMPHLGINAAGLLLLALKDLGAPAPFCAMADLTGLAYDGDKLGIRRCDAESGDLTCNLGLLRFDGRALTATLDIRYPVCADETDMVSCAADRCRPGGIEVRLESSHTPLHVPAEHKIVRGLLQMYNEITGENAGPIAIGGGTYSRMMPNTVAFGPCFPDEQDMCHMPDEFIDVERMLVAVRIYAHAIAALASHEIE